MVVCDRKNRLATFTINFGVSVKTIPKGDNTGK